ncbi:MAG: hypothetical protein ABII71_01080 [Candidatus Micrarchaeota archaeon]
MNRTLKSRSIKSEGSACPNGRATGRIRNIAAAAVLAAGLMMPGMLRAQTCPTSVSFSEAGKIAATRFESAVKSYADFSKIRRLAGSALDQHMEMATFIYVDGRGRAKLREATVTSICGTSGMECSKQPSLPAWTGSRVDSLAFPSENVPPGGCIISLSEIIPRIDESSAKVIAGAPEKVRSLPPRRKAESVPADSRRFGFVQGKLVPITEKGFVDLPSGQAPDGRMQDESHIDPRTRDEAEADVVPAAKMVLDRDGFISHFASGKQLAQIRETAPAGGKAARPAALDKAAEAQCGGTGFQQSGFSWLGWMAYRKGIEPSLSKLREILGSRATEVRFRVRLYKGGSVTLLGTYGMRGDERMADSAEIAKATNIRTILDEHTLSYAGGTCEFVMGIPLEKGLKHRDFTKNLALR